MKLTVGNIGYDFGSLEAIAPYLEVTNAGVSTQWAQSVAKELKCFVTVGYPEITATEPTKRYNSIVTVAPDSSVLTNYRKSHLYYTDENWASEGKPPFFTGEIKGLGLVALGICMDINPYQFKVPWDRYEFASNALAAKVPLIVVSMAWLTRLSEEELVNDPAQPDMNSVTYWIERFAPFFHNRSQKPTIIICANRCGNEGNVWYAGSSAVICIKDGKVIIHDALGKYEERCLVTEVEM